MQAGGPLSKPALMAITRRFLINPLVNQRWNDKTKLKGCRDGPSQNDTKTGQGSERSRRDTSGSSLIDFMLFECHLPVWPETPRNRYNMARI